MIRIILLLLFIAASAAMKSQTMVVHHKDGTTTRIHTNVIDSVTFSLSSEETEEDAPSYSAIDLGLSVKWAEINVGATTQYEPGNYYSWGELETKEDYSEDCYLYYINDDYASIGSDISATSYDAVREAWGEEWRLPTADEANELVTKCTWTWTERADGLSGYTITGTNGNSIFLPAAGCKPSTSAVYYGKKIYYWTSTVNSSMPSSAYNINYSGYTGSWTANRSYGMPMRGVKDKD